MADEPRPTFLFGRGSWPEARRIAEVLRTETVGAVPLLAAAVGALIWANSPWAGGNRAMRDFTLGPAALHLNLSVRTWAADGLLAIFFFVAGLELKREFVAGDLRDPRRRVPVVAAVGGVVVPALLNARWCGAGVGDPDSDGHRVRPGRACGGRPAGTCRPRGGRSC